MTNVISGCLGYYVTTCEQRLPLDNRHLVGAVIRDGSFFFFWVRLLGIPIQSLALRPEMALEHLSNLVLVRKPSGSGSHAATLPGMGARPATLRTESNDTINGVHHKS